MNRQSVQRHQQMRILLILGIPALAIVAAVAMMSLRQEPPKNDRVDLDPLVDVIELRAIAANFEVGSQGTVRPRTETILSAEVSGTITSISPKFIAGGVFQANEVLMRIDPTNYKVAVDQAEALVAQRQIEYDGAKKLKSQGYRAEAEYASAAAALATANAEQVRARRNLERTFIRLPYEGIVRAKEADLGQFVSPGTRLGVTFATDYAEIRLPLTDQDLAFVDLPGASAVTASGNAEGPAVVLTAVQKGQPEEWLATIVRTEGVVDEKSRVTYAVASVHDPYRLHSDGPALPMGTFVSASIDGAAVSGIFRVPNSSVRGADRLLFIDEDNTLRIRSVDIIRSDSEYSYLRGANEGERIVTSALETPVNGMAVRTAADSTDTTSQVATKVQGDER
jgi:RND family efflux transporter MFP subunit